MTQNTINEITQRAQRTTQIALKADQKTTMMDNDDEVINQVAGDDPLEIIPKTAAMNIQVIRRTTQMAQPDNDRTTRTGWKIRKEITKETVLENMVIVTETIIF